MFEFISWSGTEMKTEVLAKIIQKQADEKAAIIESRLREEARRLKLCPDCGADLKNTNQSQWITLQYDEERLDIYICPNCETKTP